MGRHSTYVYIRNCINQHWLSANAEERIKHLYYRAAFRDFANNNRRSWHRGVSTKRYQKRGRNINVLTFLSDSSLSTMDKPSRDGNDGGGGKVGAVAHLKSSRDDSSDDETQVVPPPPVPEGLVEGHHLHPHARHDCSNFDFVPDIVLRAERLSSTLNISPECIQELKSAMEMNALYCDFCYCYICDRPAKECRFWRVSHCFACDKGIDSEKWTQRRRESMRNGGEEDEANLLIPEVHYKQASGLSLVLSPWGIARPWNQNTKSDFGIWFEMNRPNGHRHNCYICIERLIHWYDTTPLSVVCLNGFYLITTIT